MHIHAVAHSDVIYAVDYCFDGKKFASGGYAICEVTTDCHR